MKRTLLLGLCALATVAHASGISGATQRRIEIATQVVNDRQQSARPIPDYVLAQTRCLASLKVVKVGLIWGGQGSTGLVSCRNGGTWSTPSFLNVGGVTFGIQIGIQFIESVVLFMTDTSRDVLNRASFQVGADLSFSAGPVGGGSGVGFTPRTALLTYDKARGLFAGATINGFVLSHGEQRNTEVYGAGLSPTDILRTPGASGPAEVQEFVRQLEKIAP